MPKVVTPNNLENFGRAYYTDTVRKFGRITGLAIGATAIIHDGGNGYDGWLNDIAEGTEEDISIVSDSPSDVYVDGLGGHAGAELCQFTGQGADGIEKTYVVPLDGVTPVLLSTTDAGVLFQSIYTAQTYGGTKDPVAAVTANVGTITISSATSGKTMAIILPGLARTQMMIWRCPKDHYAELDKIDVYPVLGKPALIKVMGRSNITLGSWLTIGQLDVDAGGDVNITHPFPDYIAPGADLVVAITAGNNTVTCSAQMWIKKKPILNYSKLQ
jgi:hypothetical protein